MNRLTPHKVILSMHDSIKEIKNMQNRILDKFIKNNIYQERVLQESQRTIEGFEKQIEQLKQFL